jgi:hypothetical protein
MQARVAHLLAEELRKCKVILEALCKQPKSHPLKIRIAEKLHRETPMTLRCQRLILWLASPLPAKEAK